MYCPICCYVSLCCNQCWLPHLWQSYYTTWFQNWCTDECDLGHHALLGSSPLPTSFVLSGVFASLGFMLLDFFFLIFFLSLMKNFCISKSQLMSNVKSLDVFWSNPLVFVFDVVTLGCGCRVIQWELSSQVDLEQWSSSKNHLSKFVSKFHTFINYVAAIYSSSDLFILSCIYAPFVSLYIHTQTHCL